MYVICKYIYTETMFYSSIERQNSFFRKTHEKKTRSFLKITHLERLLCPIFLGN